MSGEFDSFLSFMMSLVLGLLVNFSSLLLLTVSVSESLLRVSLSFFFFNFFFFEAFTLFSSSPLEDRKPGLASSEACTEVRELFSSEFFCEIRDSNYEKDKRQNYKLLSEDCLVCHLE